MTSLTSNLAEEIGKILPKDLSSISQHNTIMVEDSLVKILGEIKIDKTGKVYLPKRVRDLIQSREFLVAYLVKEGKEYLVLIPQSNREND